MVTLIQLWLRRCKTFESKQKRRVSRLLLPKEQRGNWEAATIAFEVLLGQVESGEISEETRNQLVRLVKAEVKDISKKVDQDLLDNLNLLITELENLT